jgi:endonuclease/exonuclease/phosphatase family metal-dependent hydrolase
VRPLFRLGLLAAPVLVAGLAAWRSTNDPTLDLGSIDPGDRRLSPTEVADPPPILRVMTLNLAHGRRHARRQSLLRRHRLGDNLAEVGDVIAREAPDVVALQEADGPSVWSGHFDHVGALARYADFPHAYRGEHARIPWPMKIRYGTALLGRVPLRSPSSQPFDRSWRDTKGFVLATVAVPGFDGLEVDLVSVHLDFMRPKFRREQVAEVVRALEPRTRPLIVMGDLNCAQDEAAMLGLMEGLGLHASDPDQGARTYPSRAPRLRIDWILLSEELTFRDHRTLPDLVSDHRGIVSEIGLSEPQVPAG